MTLLAYYGHIERAAPVTWSWRDRSSHAELVQPVESRECDDVLVLCGTREAQQPPRLTRSLLLAATDRAIGLVDWFAACFTDHRCSDRRPTLSCPCQTLTRRHWLISYGPTHRLNMPNCNNPLPSF
jgi:hypothetical protein